MIDAPGFSLVIATLGRTAELALALASLQNQGDIDLETIIVDQNADDRLVPIIAPYSAALSIRHIRAPIRNSAYARNVGLVHCRGDIVGFPDDDCLYPPGLLARIADEFARDPGLGVLTGTARTASGAIGSGRWSPARAPISRANAFTTVICFNLFLRRELAMSIGGFDEQLGVGSVFGSCEENDLVIRAIATGAAALYDPAIGVIHPDKRLTRVALARAFTYGAGFGYVLRKHRYGLPTIATYLIRPAGGALLSLVRGRWLACGYFVQTLRGRLYGYAKGRPAH
jgi:glycosyltransferase involved in cell wall biosynthesis